MIQKRVIRFHISYIHTINPYTFLFGFFIRVYFKILLLSATLYNPFLVFIT